MWVTLAIINVFMQEFCDIYFLMVLGLIVLSLRFDVIGMKTVRNLLFCIFLGSIFYGFIGPLDLPAAADIPQPSAIINPVVDKIN